VEAVEARRAVDAAMSTASALGLAAEDAVVLNDSNRLVARLLPCDAVARVSPVGWFSAAREVELARRLGESGAPIAGLDPRVEPRVHECDGFEIALWAHVDGVDASQLAPADYAYGLEQLHRSLRRVDMRAPHFTDRLAEIQRWLADPALTPELTDEDRALLVDRIANPGPVLLDRSATEQLLHGEPHPWNVLVTTDGPRFIDFENTARGPVEYDLAWVPSAVSERYRGADQELVAECRGVVVALIAAHRWHRDDQHPSGREGGVAFLEAVRQGPPWPALESITW
jgi:hypothetical protein